MEEMTALDLCVPPTRKPDRDSFDCRPSAVEAWLKNLPVANLGETSRAVYEALREVNQLRVKPAARLHFLETLGDRLGYTISGLRKHYPAREFPLPPKNRKVAELALALLREMATGYNILVRGGLDGEFKLGRKELTQAIHRAVAYSGRLLVETYGLYEPCPGMLWKNIHSLYLCAESRGLLDQPVPDNEIPGRARSTIADRYKQVLLLAAAGPYRMRHNEAADTYAVLARWAPHSRLLPASAPEAQSATFHVDLRSDLPPLPNAKARGGDDRVLVTTSLLQFVQNSQHQKRPWWKVWAPKPEPVDADLANRLMIALGPIPKRQFSRQPIASRAEVLVGLAQITRVLAEQNGMDLPTGETTQFSSRDVRNADQTDNDVWELLNFGGVDPVGARARNARKAAAEAEAEAESARKKAAPPAEGRQWRLLNISAGGYCLLSDPTQSARAQVGELVALRELNDGQETWQIGTVRWMKHLPAEGLQLGVQVLGPHPVPVVLKPEQADGSFGPVSRGLMLPEVLATEQPLTLITPSLHFVAQRKALLSGFGNATEIELTRALESTGAFCQFEFRSVSSAKGQESFDSVFSSI